MCFGSEGSFKERATPREGELSRIKAAKWAFVCGRFMHRKNRRNTMQYNSFALGHMGGLWQTTRNNIRSESPAKHFRYFTSCRSTIADVMEIVYGNNDMVNDPSLIMKHKTSLLKWIMGFVFQPMECIHYLGEDNVILMTAFQPPGTPVGAGREGIVGISNKWEVPCDIFLNMFFCSGEWLAADPGD